MVQEMLINKLHTLNINCDKFDESKKLLEYLNRKFKEIETYQNDPENYIDEYCRELTRKVDLRREQLFESIGKYSTLLVMQIDEWKSGLLAKANENGTRVAEEKLKDCKAKLSQLNLMFESMEIDNFKMEEIMSKKAPTELAELLIPIAEEYRRELLGWRTFELKTKDIRMEEVFGKLQMQDVSLQIKVMLFMNERIIKLFYYTNYSLFIIFISRLK